MKIKLTLVFILGWLSLGLGTIGIFLPLLPTTPLVLLAAVCFSYSSDRFSKWLEEHPRFSPYIEAYRQKRGVTMAFKIKNIIFLWVTLFISMFILRAVWAYVLLCGVGVFVTTILLRLKTRRDT